MNISLNLGAWNSIFAVPCALVDQHIKLAGGAQLKVLLWILRHAGESFSAEDISTSLNMAAPDVKDAMNYWVETGLLTSQEHTLTPSGAAPTPLMVPLETNSFPAKSSSPLPIIEESATDSPPIVPAPEPAKMSTAKPKPTGIFLAERIQQSAEIAFLMQESQQILGRAISPALSSILLSAYDDYGLPVDVIIMLLAYVKSIGKANSNYIEAVAKNWSAEEIFTHEKAEEKLRHLSETAQAWRSIENALGIDHRSPSAREEQFANRWVQEWKFSPPMLREAYDRCVDSIGKMDLKYIDKILERWHKEGIVTPQQAFWEKAEKATARKPEKETKRTYDMDAYENFDFLQAELPGLHHEEE